jgi:hypothetical protein
MSVIFWLVRIDPPSRQSVARISSCIYLAAVKSFPTPTVRLLVVGKNDCYNVFNAVQRHPSGSCSTKPQLRSFIVLNKAKDPREQVTVVPKMKEVVPWMVP